MKTTILKKRRELIYRVIAALVAGLTIAVASYAWYTYRNIVDVNNMGISIQNTKNLIIADTPENIVTTSNFYYSFHIEQQILKEATHDWTVGANTGLAYLTNTDKVDSKSGVPNTTAEYSEVIYDAATGTSRYYKDYVVCIGSLGDELPLAHLYASIAPMGKTVDQLVDYQKATSVDFYLESVSTANYRGTLNLAGYDYRNNKTPLTRVDLNNSATPETEPIVIPYHKNVSKNCIQVVMRFYYDGNLRKVDTVLPDQTYIYADKLFLGTYGIEVAFEGIEPLADNTDDTEE